MKLMCKLFGHKWVLEAGCTFCWRCGKDYNESSTKCDYSPSEKWLDKHMD